MLMAHPRMRKLCSPTRKWWFSEYREPSLPFAATNMFYSSSSSSLSTFKSFLILTNEIHSLKVPSFLTNADQLKSRGVDSIICV